MNFSNKTAIVTGGTRGIGRSVAELFSSLGCRTIITGTKPIEKVRIDANKCEYLELNLEQKSSVERFLKKINTFPCIDILVNNAGINIIEPIDKISIENWEKILQVNLTGPLILMKNVARIMQRKKYGRIVNISSIFGLISKEKRGAYSASKSGLIGLTRAAAIDLAKDNILVNAVCPGFTKTELTFSILSPQEQKELADAIPLGRFAEVDEIAKTVLFLCSDGNSYITGQAIVVDGGYTIR